MLTLLRVLAVLSAPDIRELKRTAGQDEETDVLWLLKELKFSRHERALKACIATLRLVASFRGLFRLFYLAAELQTLPEVR